ncbi:hypothetical protein M0R89_11735 [Halorussus limi]|uniref:Uncharacterized protein n=1 Tax=Halorussus limi TaxID=2938695 RepID=A0A8U0HQR3_9EURY|nr:hypothetical protein [Halorussus limi]UPV73218.1 hypothetical protein M0R89_11735 [Halorussus limi]
MSQERLSETPAPTVGVVAALAVLAAIVAPYFLIDATAAGVYYSEPTFVPVHLVVGLFATVAVVVFAAGRNGRTDAPTAAGVTVVLGGFMALLVLWWAVSVGDLVGSLTANATFDYHRWLLLATSVAVAASAGWFAREVL